MGFLIAQGRHMQGSDEKLLMGKNAFHGRVGWGGVGWGGGEPGEIFRKVAL